MKKLLITLAICLTPVMTQAQTLYPTIPGTGIRDYSQPGYKVESPTVIVPTLPGTDVRDFTRSGIVRDGNTLYPTIPGTVIRDYTKPGYVVER